MTPKLVIKALGGILWAIGIVILLPVVFALFFKEYDQILPYVATSLFAITLAFLFGLKKVPEKELDNIKKPDALAIVFFAWFLFGVVCSVPYFFYGFSPINALFESVSGITSTGSTIVQDFTLYSKTFFFYRSLTQWMGGMGIVVMFVAILPKFAIAGRQIFFTELPGPVEENITPRVQHSALWLWKIYIGLTLVQILLLKFVGGLDIYNAICNSFSTMSSGGFSPNPLSIMGYNNPKVTWITIVFMVFSGANFILLYKFFIQKKFTSILKNEELRVYLGINIVLGLIVALILYFENGYGIQKAITDGIYQVLAISTSTGSASADFALWSFDAKIILFATMFLGGCAASTSGGIKIARWIFVFRHLKREVAKIIHPQGVYLVKLEGKVVGEETVSQLMAFVIFYLAIFVISAFAVGLIEQNVTMALSGSICTLGNIGPGFGSIIGPMGGFASLAGSTKCIFIFNMLVGRLELIPFLAFLHPDMWRKY